METNNTPGTSRRADRLRGTLLAALAVVFAVVTGMSFGGNPLTSAGYAGIAVQAGIGSVAFFTGRGGRGVAAVVISLAALAIVLIVAGFFVRL